MKLPLVLASLALVLSALAFMASAWRGLSGRVEEAVPTALAPSGPDADLLTRLTALEEEQRRLRDELALGRHSGAAPSRTPAGDFATRDELDALREELSAGAAGAGGLAPAELEGQVAEAMETLRLEEAFIEAVAEQEDRAASLDGRVELWAEWLTLDELQSSQLKELMARRDQASKDALDAWANGLDFAAVQELGRIADEQFRVALTAQLDPDQLKRYEAKFSDGDAK